MSASREHLHKYNKNSAQFPLTERFSQKTASGGPDGPPDTESCCRSTIPTQRSSTRGRTRSADQPTSKLHSLASRPFGEMIPRCRAKWEPALRAIGTRCAQTSGQSPARSKASPLKLAFATSSSHRGKGYTALRNTYYLKAFSHSLKNRS